MKSSKTIRGNMMLTLTALIWGTAFVAQSVGMDYVGPFTFNAVRSIIGGMVLIPCILFLDKNKRRNIQEQERPLSNKPLVVGGILCGIVLFMGSTLQQFGLIHATAGKAGFITALYIVIVPILGIFFNKRVPTLVWGGVILALIGLYLLCINEDFSLGMGDAYLLIGALFFAMHILVIDYYSPMVDGVRLSCIQFFIAGGIGLIMMFVFEQPQLSAILACWVPILYTGVMSSGIAYTLQILGQRNVSPTVASLVMSLESIFAALAGWFILGETLTTKELTGCLFVFIATIVSQIELPSRRIAKEEIQDIA